ncbi:lysophospholipid acyltransferase family protein [Terrabacter sp. GCM10028922]|uniref:lysophospholipid acyltransferase family protein n=1 Tax=Terrabacter sp. GCM10028922 TaxID=3273428 RepID=UPI00361E78D1
MNQAVAPHPNRARIGRPIGKFIFSTLYRGAALHPERVPMTGPVILVANHAAFLDGPLVFGLSPRPVSFLVKQEAFSGFWGWTINAVGQIPIDRTVGDRAALAAATVVLERGGAVGIFPEGNRGSGEVEQVNSGAAWIALRTHAQIVPVAVLGTRVPGATKDDWPAFRSRLLVDFGDPFALTVDPAVPGRDRLRLATEQLRDALASHVRRSRVENGSSPDVH